MTYACHSKLIKEKIHICKINRESGIPHLSSGLPRSPHGLSGGLWCNRGSVKSCSGDACEVFNWMNVVGCRAQRTLVLDGRESTRGASAARAAGRQARELRLLDEVMHASAGLMVEARAREECGDPLQARVITLIVTVCLGWREKEKITLELHYINLY